MADLALRYARFLGATPVVVSIPRGGASRLHLPNADAKARLVTAVLKARASEGEELELLGEPTGGLDAGGRERLRRRVGAVSPIVGLIGNLNAWENISLPAAYHRSRPLSEVAEIAQAVLARFGIEPEGFLASLPDQLGLLERRIAAFVRLLAASPELALFDDIAEGLSRADRERVSGFEAEYRARQPLGTVLYLDAQEAA